MKKIIQIVGLTVIVVVLPAASWYFLKSGLDYRMASMDTLGDFGPLPETELVLYNGDRVSTAKFKEQLVITHVEPFGSDTARILKLYRQFQKRKDLHFIFAANDHLRLLEERNSNLWMLAEDASNDAFIMQMGLADKKSQIALSDITGTIREYYDVNDLERIKKLVEQTAFLLPVEETEQAKMIRENEK